MATLQEELDSLSPQLNERLRARGFRADRLIAWAQGIGKDRDQRNRLPGRVEPPLASDVSDMPTPDHPEAARFMALGTAAIEAGEVALCVLAGGMATRMGGVVKALVEALPGKLFLDLRLAEVARLSQIAGRPVPLWLMTSEATDGPIRDALSERLGDAAARSAKGIETFEQFVSLRLDPNGLLFREDDGDGRTDDGAPGRPAAPSAPNPSVYATGHGDLPEALQASGHLAKFVANGGKYVWMANLDNLGATVDPLLLGWHIAHPSPLTVEVVDKVAGDKGGGPVRYMGRRLIVEEFRLPIGFDPKTVPVFNTNTFLIDAAALASFAMEFTYVEVEKKIGGRVAIQFERLLGEITAAIEPQFVRVPRDGDVSRFLPVKDHAEHALRKPAIEAALRARKILS